MHVHKLAWSNIETKNIYAIDFPEKYYNITGGRIIAIQCIVSNYYTSAGKSKNKKKNANEKLFICLNIIWVAHSFFPWYIVPYMIYLSLNWSSF